MKQTWGGIAGFPEKASDLLLLQSVWHPRCLHLQYSTVDEKITYLWLLAGAAQVHEPFLIKSMYHLPHERMTRERIYSGENLVMTREQR
jgi:hypothetical protein